MRTRTTQIHDGLIDDELYETFEGLKQHHWSHSITLGVAGDDITYGDVWMSVNKGLAKLTRNDPAARYAIWICKNVQSDGTEGRPHAHGVILTQLVEHRIKACFYTYGNHSYRCVPLAGPPALEGWCEYFLPQSVRNAALMNVAQEEYV